MLLTASGKRGKVAYRAQCIAPGDLRFDSLYADALKHDTALKEALWHHLSSLGAVRAYAPFASPMNREVVSTDALDGGCPNCDPGEVVCLKGPGQQGIPLYRNNKRAAEIVPIMEAGVAAVFPLGGCATCVAYGKGILLVAHAGQRSFIDPGFFAERRRIRRPTVIETMARTARYLGAIPENLDFHVLFALPGEAYSHSLDDPEHGETNRRMLAFYQECGSRAVREKEGRIFVDVAQLALEEARAHHFHKVRKCQPLPVEGAFGHTRHPDPAMRAKRNAAIIVRTA